MLPGVSITIANGKQAAEWPESVVLDPEAFSLYHEEGPLTLSSFCCYCSGCTTPITLAAVLENTRYLLLAPTRLEGFRLETRKWAAFAIPDLLYHKPRPEMITDSERFLTMHLDKTLAASLKNDLSTYLARRKSFLDMMSSGDFVAGRLGRGLVLQFHGECWLGMRVRRGNAC